MERGLHDFQFAKANESKIEREKVGDSDTQTPFDTDLTRAKTYTNTFTELMKIVIKFWSLYAVRYC